MTSPRCPPRPGSKVSRLVGIRCGGARAKSIRSHPRSRGQVPPQPRPTLRERILESRTTSIASSGVLGVVLRSPTRRSNRYPAATGSTSAAIPAASLDRLSADSPRAPTEGRRRGFSVEVGDPSSRASKVTSTARARPLADDSAHRSMAVRDATKNWPDRPKEAGPSRLGSTGSPRDRDPNPDSRSRRPSASMAMSCSTTCSPTTSTAPGSWHSGTPRGLGRLPAPEHPQIPMKRSPEGPTDASGPPRPDA